MLDFTTGAYQKLCEAIKYNGFLTISVGDYLESSDIKSKYAIIRHDVDRKPKNALKIATIEKRLGIKSTFYFRHTKETFVPRIMASISKLGHEIGYHYEVLVECKGNYKTAINLFSRKLEAFRSIIPVNTICMHGSPMSKWTDSDLWAHYDYNEFNIIGEAFLSIDYTSVHYYTDTGRTWNGQNFNIRDKVNAFSNEHIANSTFDLISVLGKIDNSICLNTHPQRWTDSRFQWTKELVSQNTKNFFKKHFLVRQHNV